jgi:hypothetical protein
MASGRSTSTMSYWTGSMTVISDSTPEKVSSMFPVATLPNASWRRQLDHQRFPRCSSAARYASASSVTSGGRFVSISAKAFVSAIGVTS